MLVNSSKFGANCISILWRFISVVSVLLNCSLFSTLGFFVKQIVTLVVSLIEIDYIYRPNSADHCPIVALNEIIEDGETCSFFRNRAHSIRR